MAGIFAGVTVLASDTLIDANFVDYLIVAIYFALRARRSG